MENVDRIPQVTLTIGTTPAEERMAEALAIQKLYGKDAPLWIAERIGALAVAGDAAGVARFQEIAAAFARHLLSASNT